ncbi:MAG: hypothetical protein K1Y36_24520 [Blastocatellia bacterium]|nr:hypothetical protein [Blastocatellia bacterium]
MKKIFLTGLVAFLFVVATVHSDGTKSKKQNLARLCQIVDLLDHSGDLTPEVLRSPLFVTACREAGITATIEAERLAQIRAGMEQLRVEARQSQLEALEPLSSKQLEPAAGKWQDEAFYQGLQQFVVTNTNDSGDGSLRQAVVNAEMAKGGNVVFQLEKSDPNFNAASGTWRISLLKSGILIKGSNILIDGKSQTTYGGDTNPKGPEIILDGKAITESLKMIDGQFALANFSIQIFEGNQNWIRGLAFDSGLSGMFANGAITITTNVSTIATGNKITDNFIGLSSDGETLISGSMVGIDIFRGVQNTLIENNTISCAAVSLILQGNSSFPQTSANNCQSNTITNNRFQTNNTGNRRVAPLAWAVGVTGVPTLSVVAYDGTKDNVFEGNIIGGTRSGGIGILNESSIFALTTDTFRNNRIGVGVNGENIAPGSLGDTSGDPGTYACGILATPQNTITDNIIGNFKLAGITMRNLNGNPNFPTADILRNTISNCTIGLQIGQMQKGANVANNTFRDCQAGLVVAESMLDAAFFYAPSPKPSPNPTGLPSINIVAAGNRFAGVTGPGIALVHDVQDILLNRYQPNLATDVVNGFGPNEFQPTPVLMTANRASDGSVMVTGRTIGAGTLELSISERPPRPDAPDTDVTAYGMGTPVGMFSVPGGPFQVTIPTAARDAASLTATVTVNGQTSEFARTVAVQASQPPPDTISPTVTVTAPTAGQQIESKAGTQVSIVWQSSDNVGVVRHDVWLARPGPGAVDIIASGLAGTAQSFTWNVPENLEVPQAQIVVMAFDAAGNQGQGVSGMFTVKKPVVVPPDTEKPVVTTVTLSKKKVKRNVDPTVTISWKSTDNVGVTTQGVLYATDGTNFSLTVAAGLPGTAQSFTWTVPNTLAKSKIGVVKVVASDAAGNTGEAVSNPFVIK